MGVRLVSRKIVLQVPVDVTVRDRDVRVLAAVDELAVKPCAEVSASIRSFAIALDVSVDTARRALASCEDAGYLTIRTNRLENGGQVENTYAITSTGYRVLQAARSAGLL